MAYYTGTVSSAAELKTIIETECGVNSWSSSGGWLSKGNSHVSLGTSSVTNAAGTFELVSITGANSTDGLTTPAGWDRYLVIKSTYFPITYHLFILTDPDVVVCVVTYDIYFVQVLLFGDIVKVHSSAFTGGNFFFATCDVNSATIDGLGNFTFNYAGLNALSLTSISSISTNIFSDPGMVIPFAPTVNPNSANINRNALHCEIDGAIWDTGSKISYTDSVIAALFRSPNSWNQQTHLVPMRLQYAMASSLYAYLGYIEHIRLVRVDNYELGDIIEIAPDSWKVFPWLKKDAALRNGDAIGYQKTGTVGFAVRYDGP